MQILSTLVSESEHSHLRTPQQPTQQGCVLYCRVSNRKQIREGNGLGSQELTCRNYAASRGYRVLEVFRDGVSGGISGRKGLQELLTFLEQHPPGLVVIIDDLKRFARDVELHFGLKRTILHCGARLESPLFRFEDTPEGKFIETMMAAQAELERNQNQRQVMRRMRARLEQGFWVFVPPPGYIYHQHPLAKKLLVPGEKAPLVREALEGFASGRFAGVADVERFLLEHGFFGTRQTFRGSRLSRVLEMLSNVVYAGWIEYRDWGITLRKGQHEGLIAFATYERIQERLNTRTFVRTEKSQRRVFALRGVLLCEHCHRHLTASRSRGEQGKYYEYYHCAHQECDGYGKMLPVRVVETAFAELLRPLTLGDDHYTTVAGWLESHQEEDTQARQTVRAGLETELNTISQRIDELAETISQTHHPIVIASLEGKVDNLVQQQATIMARMQDSVNHVTIDIRTLLDDVGMYLRNPLQIWKTDNATVRQTLARLVFGPSVIYSRETGFQTPNLSLPHRFFGLPTKGRSALVDSRIPFQNQKLIPKVVEELVRWREVLREVPQDASLSNDPAGYEPGG